MTKIKKAKIEITEFGWDAILEAINSRIEILLENPKSPDRDEEIKILEDLPTPNFK